MINVNPVKNESYFQENGENKIEKKCASNKSARDLERLIARLGKCIVNIKL